MLYSVIICIAYVIGILWGLYLNFSLSIVLIFLLICVNLSLKYFFNISFIKSNEISIFKIIFIIIFSFIIGELNVKFRVNNFENKYSNRRFIF